MKTISIDIDGPSGAGKSTLAKSVSKTLGYLYVDTGAIYRTIGYAAFSKGVDPKDGEAAAALLPELEIGLHYGEDGLQHMTLNGADVTDQIRLPEISLYASAVSAHPAVRAHLLEMQRKLARENNVRYLFEASVGGHGEDLPDGLCGGAGHAPLPGTGAAGNAGKLRKGAGGNAPAGLQRFSPGSGTLEAGGGRRFAGYHGAGLPAERGSASSDHPREDEPMNERRTTQPFGPFFPLIFTVARWICRLLHPVTVQGLENLPRHGALLVANHASNWDPLVLATALPMDYRLRVMGKEELFRNPILAWVIRVGGAFPVNRGGADIQAVKTAIQTIQSGHNLLIFPEGTTIRNGIGKTDGLPAHAHSGAAVIGVRTGAILVPVFVDGEKRTFHRTRIIIGQPYTPVYTGRRGTAEEMQKIADELLREVYALGGQQVGGAPLCK